MKFEITEEMRETLAERREHRAVVNGRCSPYETAHREESLRYVEAKIARLVAEAVEKGETGGHRQGRCTLPVCAACREEAGDA